MQLAGLGNSDGGSASLASDRPGQVLGQYNFVLCMMRLKPINPQKRTGRLPECQDLSEQDREFWSLANRSACLALIETRPGSETHMEPENHWVYGGS